MDQEIPRLAVGLRCKMPDGSSFVVTEIGKTTYTIEHSIHGKQEGFRIVDFPWHAGHDIRLGGVYTSPKQETLKFIKQHR